MTPVEFHFVTPDGSPVANTDFEVQLSKAAFDPVESGVLMPRPVTGTTDADGKARLDLWPSDGLYYVSVYDTESEAGLSYKFFVPELDVPGGFVRLQDIVVEGARSETPWDDAALLVVLTAKAAAVTAAGAAAASAQGVQALRDEATAQALASAASAEAAASRATVAESRAAAAAVSSSVAQAAADVALSVVGAPNQETREAVLALSLQVTTSVTSLAASVTRMSAQIIQNELTA